MKKNHNINEIEKMIIENFPNLSIIKNTSWSKVSTFGIGGAIQLLAEPQSDIELMLLLKFCAKNNIKIAIIGAGSNVAGTDETFNGLVIRIRQGCFQDIKHGRTHITVGAGLKLSELLRYSAKHGFGGAAELAGIPGTVGGAIKMNAGANGKVISDYIVDLFGYHIDGTPWAAEDNEISWEYRDTNIPKDIVVTGCILKFERVDADKELTKISDVLKNRRLIEPKKRNAGCMFKNIDNALSAGIMIDRAGCKGMSVNGMSVSREHANYLVNDGTGTEADLIELCKQVKAAVYEKFNVLLQTEVKFFSDSTVAEIENFPIPPKVAVIMGGDSNEREISLNSGQQVVNALQNAGFEVAAVTLDSPVITPEMKDADIVFSTLHGGFGENGTMQKVLEDAHVNFVGSDSVASKLIMDKSLSKQLADKHGILTAKYQLITKDNSQTLPVELNFPIILKPANEGSTVGIELIENENEYYNAIEKALQFDEVIVAEEFIEGNEYTVAIVDDVAYMPVQIEVPGKFYDYDAKYIHSNGDTNYYCPPQIGNDKLFEKLKEISLKFFRVSEAKDILRVDFIVDKSNNCFFLEANSLPGFTKDSLVPKALAHSELYFSQLCAKLVVSCLKR
ncbi:UDP-N-acetylmuramate dehydrogenase [Lentisphaerota bacterium WC36G]|nr:UDP-N-acetylmuramate dehydrogenase [Lentisphaerae bacterium WC36]